ncbi:unnamed protein product [Adineta steineri]|uniref:Annexin n=1 Tax=Adineta steineri TaxID=433720 RepID=A0A815D2Y0_9BILA|nr:unnamed protein product [Adineta steineri]
MKTPTNNYGIEGLERPTTAESHQPSTIIKYMGHRTIGVNVPNSYQGSLRNFVLQQNGSTYNKSAPTSTNHGFASLVHSTSFSTLTPLHSIDGDRAIDEQRELSRITDTLTESILQCCSFEAHNCALELQIEWLENNTNKNTSTIDKMFRQEIQTANHLIEDALRSKPDLEKKLKDIHQTTLANDGQYQQLLSKRNTTNKELFEYHRKMAQIRAESEFLRCRLQQFNDEIQFYTVKNDSLNIRQVKLRYELDEELFAKHVLQMEFDVLQSEKITQEDVHLAAVNEIRGSIDTTQIATVQPSNYYREQLGHQVRRFRSEYEKKIETYRDELHRKLELELHRYKTLTIRPVPVVTREHEEKLDQFNREKKITDQQISSTRGSIKEIESQIGILEQRINDGNVELRSTSNAERHLAMFEQIIHEREKQFNDALRIRGEFKQRIEKYREEIHRYQTKLTHDTYDTKELQEISKRKSILRSSSAHDVRGNSYYEESSSSLNTTQRNSLLLSMNQNITNRIDERSSTVGTLIQSTNFNVEQDEAAIIRILCNRSVSQRLQIRDIYKNRFNKNLGDIIETDVNGDSKRILKLLLLSPIERDCYELRRILKGQNPGENILIEIFLTNSNKQIKTIINYYFQLFNNTLEQDIRNDRENPSKQIFLSLLQANRPEDNRIDEGQVVNDARNLYDSRSKWQTDGSTFIQLLCNRNNAHLKQTFAAYQQFNRFDIEQSIRNDTNADLSRTLMAIVRIIRNQARFFAYELRKSLKGSSTNEHNLSRIIVSRCEIDLVSIKSEYEKITPRTLFDHIQTDTKGNYKRALLELLRQRIEPVNKELLEPIFNNRPTVKWQEPVQKQSFGRSKSTRDISDIKQFDRDNQGKMSTILRLPTKSQYVERRTVDKYPNTNDNQNEY